jgi:hypothetical protein
MPTRHGELSQWVGVPVDSARRPLGGVVVNPPNRVRATNSRRRRKEHSGY